PAPFTIRLDESTLNARDHLAKKTDRSRNWLVSRAVEDCVGRLQRRAISKSSATISSATIPPPATGDSRRDDRPRRRSLCHVRRLGYLHRCYSPLPKRSGMTRFVEDIE